MGNCGSDPDGNDGSPIKQFEYEWNSINPTNGVVEAVATATGKGVTGLTPLYQEVDPDALNALVSKLPTDGELITVSFTYAGQKVTVNNEGVVIVAPDVNGSSPDDDPDDPFRGD